jgi:RimJ/RimL family protein N-acetyltransferase
VTSAGPVLRTDRLVLRPWRESDREPHAAMNADPEVMEFFPSVMDRAASDAWFDRMQHGWDEYGFGLLAVEDSRGFVGFVGLAVPRFELPFSHLADPPVEIGWRLVRRAWGRGLATEGATACVDWAFGDLRLPEVLSWTAEVNVRSRAVMERIGMHHDPDDEFDHPKLTDESPVRRHVVYRLLAGERPAVSDRAGTLGS